NLYLAVGAGGARSWTLLYRYGGKTREMGLGSCLNVSLALARKKAAQARSQLGEGIDPLDARKAIQRAAHAPKFGEVALALIKAKRVEWRSSKHAGQWETTLRTYCASLWDRPVAEIATEDVLAVLTPLWERAPETASRVRSRIENVI